MTKALCVILYVPILIVTLPAYLGSLLIAFSINIFKQDVILSWPSPHKFIEGIMEEVFDD